MGGCMSVPPMTQLTFMPPTMKAISDIAHGDRSNELTNPACVLPRYRVHKNGTYKLKPPGFGVKRTFCRHELSFLWSRTASKLFAVGLNKNKFKKVTPSTIGKTPRTWPGEDEYYSRFIAPYFKYRNSRDRDWFLCPRISSRDNILYMTQRPLAKWRDDAAEWRLLQYVNKLGGSLGVEIEDTGAWTVAKAYNRMELEAMKDLKWDDEQSVTFKQYQATEKAVKDVEAFYDALHVHYEKNEDPGPRSAVRVWPSIVNPLPYSFVMSYGS